MKAKLRFVICIFVLLFGFKLVNVQASDYNFIWSNTTITIPVGGNFSDYNTIPTAKLYYKGGLVVNAEVSYQRTGIGSLYPASMVDTNVVGTYIVEYRAYEYNFKVGDCDGFKQNITFNVQDVLAPVITVHQEPIIITYKETKFDYTRYISVLDDVTIPCELVLVDSDIAFGELGEYTYTVRATDDAGNTSYYSGNVWVQDTFSPMIYYNSLDSFDFIVEYEENFDLRDYLYATDEFDGDVTASIEVLAFDPTILGKQTVVVKAYDSSGNWIRGRLLLELIDNTSPVITLSKSTFEIEYSSDLAALDFKSFIIGVDDDFDDLTVDDVTISGDTTIDGVGSYDVTYSAVDSSLNLTEKTIRINVLANEKPEIIVTNPTLDLGESFNYIDYISVTDESDTDVMDNLKVLYNDVNTAQEGQYSVVVSVYNSSGLFTDARIIVNVVDSKLNSIIEEEASSFDYSQISLWVVGSIIGIVGIVFIKKKLFTK